MDIATAMAKTIHFHAPPEVPEAELRVVLRDLLLDLDVLHLRGGIEVPAQFVSDLRHSPPAVARGPRSVT